MKHILISSALFCLIGLNSSFANSQIKNLKNDSPYPTKYISADDANLTLKTLIVAPAYDNVGGIYQAVAEKELSELISKDQFWAVAQFQWPQNIPKEQQRVDIIAEKPLVVQQILKASQASGLVSTIITKSSQGINVNLILYTQDNGLPLLQLSYQDPTTFEIAKFKEILSDLYNQMKQKLPYKALITSRRGNKVTINAGLNANLKKNDQLSVAQIIKINRHPKLKFMTGIEKEIIGQIKLTQVEEFSSFAEINFEKEAGVIEKNSKLLPPDFVNYQNAEVKTTAGEEQNTEWKPQAAPQFGKITLLGGFSDYKLSTVLTSGSSFDTGNKFAPTFLLAGDLWVTPEYFLNISLAQMYFNGLNSLTGSFPGTLNFTVNNMDLLFGYRYALNGNFWGPSLIGSVGYLSQSTKMTDTSPVAFSSFDTTGFQIQVGGYFPVTETNDVGVGLDAKFLLTSSLSESPRDSGSASPTLSQFSFYGNYLYSSNVNLKAQMVFSAVNSSFSGSGSRTNPARSIDEKVTSYLFGIEYLF
jgi:hypothetical protein